MHKDANSQQYNGKQCAAKKSNLKTPKTQGEFLDAPKCT